MTLLREGERSEPTEDSVEVKKRNKRKQIILRTSEDLVDGRLPDMMLFSIHAGPRQHEVLDLRVYQVNLRGRAVSLFKTKNHEARTVPPNGILMRMFECRLKDLPEDAYVFGDPGGERYQARRVQKECKVALSRANDEGARIAPYFTFHGCRHTFGTRLGQASKNSRQIGELMGIKSERVLRRHTHFAVEHLRGVVTALDEKWIENDAARFDEYGYCNFTAIAWGGGVGITCKSLKTLVELKGLEPSTS